MSLGFFEFLVGADVSGLWLLLLGWFLLSASRAEELQARVTQELRTTRVRELMTEHPITVDGAMGVDRILHDFVLARHCSTFPVVDHAGHCTGLVTFGRIRSVPAERRATTTVSEIAWPAGEVMLATPDELVVDVLRRGPEGGDGRIVVCDDGGVVVGIVSPTDITRALQFASVEPAARTRPVRGSERSDESAQPLEPRR